MEEPVLKLEEESVEINEEPLILEEVHNEKVVNKKTINKKSEEAKISPAARKMAKEANMDINTIEGTGKNGVILKEDVMSLMGTKPPPPKEK